MFMTWFGWKSLKETWFGWKSLKEAKRYTRATSQKRLAASVATLLERVKDGT